MGHMFTFKCICFYAYKNTSLTKANMSYHLNTYKLGFYWMSLENMNSKSAHCFCW